MTEMPSSLKRLRNSVSIITNWATFYRDVDLKGKDQDGIENILKPKLHCPIMESDGIITSVWNNAIVFRPRAGQLGMLLITRRSESDILTQENETDGPLGKRIM